MGFEPYAGTRADQLSGGTQAKLNLGLALLAIRRAAGRSVLIISHFVVDEERFDRIVEVRDGRAVPR